MNGVLGLSGLLLDSTSTQAAEDGLGDPRVGRRSHGRSWMRVLDFTQLRKGQVQLEHAPFDMSALLDGVAALMHPTGVGQSGLDLDTEMKGFTARRFIGDAGRLRQVLLNFVSNAIKFTDSWRSSSSVAEAAPVGRQCLAFGFPFATPARASRQRC